MAPCLSCPFCSDSSGQQMEEHEPSSEEAFWKISCLASRNPVLPCDKWVRITEESKAGNETSMIPEKLVLIDKHRSNWISRRSRWLIRERMVLLRLDWSTAASSCCSTAENPLTSSRMLTWRIGVRSKIPSQKHDHALTSWSERAMTDKCRFAGPATTCRIPLVRSVADQTSKMVC